MSILSRNVAATAAFVHADVTKSASVKDYVEKTVAAYGRIDAFFNNAGIEGKVVPFQDYDEEVFDQVIAVNLKGVFLGMRHVLPVMLKQGSGTIVNTASVAGLFGAPGMPAYVASKHGVLGLTKVAATDVAGSGVRVNAVCPGPVETRMMRALEAQRNPNDPDGVRAAYAAGIPTGRYALPEEIAGRGAIPLFRPIGQRDRHAYRHRWRPVGFRWRRACRSGM